MDTTHSKNSNFYIARFEVQAFSSEQIRGLMPRKIAERLPKGISDGPLDSIRFEAMLEGLQDHELLVTLAARDAEAAERICKSLLTKKKESGQRRDSVESLRATRRELCKALST